IVLSAEAPEAGTRMMAAMVAQAGKPPRTPAINSKMASSTHSTMPESIVKPWAIASPAGSLPCKLLAQAAKYTYTTRVRRKRSALKMLMVALLGLVDMEVVRLAMQALEQIERGLTVLAE